MTTLYVGLYLNIRQMAARRRPLPRGRFQAAPERTILPSDDGEGTYVTAVTCLTKKVGGGGTQKCDLGPELSSADISRHEFRLSRLVCTPRDLARPAKTLFTRHPGVKKSQNSSDFGHLKKKFGPEAELYLQARIRRKCMMFK